MKHYLFCVVKQSGETTWQSEEHWSGLKAQRWLNHHVVTVLDGEPEPDFSEIATRLANGERYLMSQNTYVLRVVCLEYDGHTFDATTKARLFVPVDNYWNLTVDQARGVRQGYCYDSFAALAVSRSRTSGRASKTWFRGCVSPRDIGRTGDTDTFTKTLKFRPDSLLQRFGVKMYWDFLEEIPHLDEFVQIDRHGEMKAIAEPDGVPRASIVSDLRTLRRASQLGEPVNDFLERATRRLAAGFRSLDYVMDNFDHTWGNGKMPRFWIPVENFWGASQVWFQLASLLGFVVNDALGHYQYELDERNWNGNELYPKRMSRLKSHQTEVLACIVALWHAEKYFIENKLYANAGYYQPYGLLAEQVSRANALYDKWPEFMSVFQRVSNAICTLSVILHSEIDKSKWTPHKIVVGQPMNADQRDKVTSDAISPMPFVGFDECLMRDAAPYITLATVEEVAVTLPVPKPPVTSIPHQMEDDEDTDTLTKAFLEAQLAWRQMIAKLKHDLWLLRQGLKISPFFWNHGYDEAMPSDKAMEE